MWRYGKEAWCNLEGRYIHIVANLTHLSTQSYEMTICTFAVFGTQYGRNSTVPASLEIAAGDAKTLEIEPIYAMLEIGNTLDIHLRQKVGSELPWVTFPDGNPKQVHFAPDGVEPGNYTVILESFDQNSGVFSTLKTDTVTVTVYEILRDEPVPTTVSLA